MKAVYCQFGNRFDMSKKTLAFYFFGLTSILDIVGIVFEIPLLIHTFKPLIIPSLLVLYVFSVQKRNNTYIAALIFSFLGDSFLMYSGDIYFMIGLLSFLMAHFLFIKIVLKRIQNPKISTVLISMIPFLVLFIGLLGILYNSLDEKLVPVIIYGLTISLFGTVALVDYLNSRSQQSVPMLIGASIFIVSDSLLAINKFYVATKVFAVLVMVTYIVAQYFIYKSMKLEADNISK